MRECWINVYKWWNNFEQEYEILHGKDYFKTENDAMRYFPSWELSVCEVEMITELERHEAYIKAYIKAMLSPIEQENAKLVKAQRDVAISYLDRAKMYGDLEVKI